MWVIWLFSVGIRVWLVMRIFIVSVHAHLQLYQLYQRLTDQTWFWWSITPHRCEGHLCIDTILPDSECFHWRVLKEHIFGMSENFDTSRVVKRSCGFYQKWQFDLDFFFFFFLQVAAVFLQLIHSGLLLDHTAKTTAKMMIYHSNTTLHLPCNFKSWSSKANLITSSADYMTVGFWGLLLLIQCEICGTSYSDIKGKKCLVWQNFLCPALCVDWCWLRLPWLHKLTYQPRKTQTYIFLWASDPCLALIVLDICHI